MGVAAAAAAIALVVTSSSTGGTVPAAAKAPAASAGTATASAPAAGSPLVTLAAQIKADAQPTGDAWLVISTQVDGTRTMQVLYTLYTDGGAIYSGYSVNDIKYAIAHHQDQMSSGGYAPLVKAAILAATSSPAQGRTTMLKAGGDPLVGLSPAAQKKVWDQEQAAAQVIIKEKGGRDSTTICGRTASRRCPPVTATHWCGRACCVFCPPSPVSASRTRPPTVRPH